MAGPLLGIAYTQAALQSLREAPKKIRRQIVDRIAKLADDPYPAGCAKLQGVSDGIFEVFRVRQGNYRVLYSVRGDTEIIILDIGHRKDIYR